MRELAVSDPDVEIVWRAYELRPEPVPTPPPGGDYLQRAWATSVLPLAARLGVTMTLPPVQPRSRLAHQAAHWARTQGRFDEYHAAIFRAFFERGEDIGRIEVLGALAWGLGLSGEFLGEALARRECEQAVLDEERTAQTLGLSGVPAFVADRRVATSGVQPAVNLKQLVEHVRTSKAPELRKGRPTWLD